MCTLASSIWARVSILLPRSTLSILTPRDFSSRSGVTHLVAQLVWPHQPENSPGRPRARQISPYFIQPSFNSIDAGSIYHPLVQLNPSINHSYLKKYLQQSSVHRHLNSFLECPLISLVLSAIVKKSSTLTSTARCTS